MIRLFRLLNSLSFDTALGAVSFAFVVSYTIQISIDPTVYLALFISVLSIYNIDHLIDSKRLNNGEKSIRHKFYQEHIIPLLIWQLALLIIGSMALFYIPNGVFWGGVIFLTLIGVYFLVIFKFHRSNFLWREVIVALGYTFAVALVPILSMGFTMALVHCWLMVIIFLIALSNLWVFAIYEVDIDRNQKHHSIARVTNVRKLEKMAGAVIGFAILSIIVFIFYFNFWILGGTFLLTELAYFTLLQKQTFFNKSEHYRLIGELVLMLPGILILLVYGF